MQVTITIPDELAAQVEARGETPESFVTSLVDGAVPAYARANKAIDLDKFFRDIALNSDKIPQLPDEAFTRASFYQDHD